MKLKPLSEQVVVVFGASSGIGRLTALRLAAKGARVLVAGRNRDGLETLVEQIQQQNGRAAWAVADAADFEQVKSVAAEAARVFGGIDTWVHIAGVGLWSKVEDTTPEEFERVMQVNFHGQLYGVKAALPFLRREGRGALIHVASVEALVAPPYQAAYTASKHALVGFLDSLRVELWAERTGVQVTAIFPAGIDTPIWDKGRTKLGVKPKPVPLIYKPEVVADLIVYAAEHRRRRLYAGAAGRFFMLGRAWMPSVSDLVVRAVAVKGQKTDDPKPPGAPDNLFHTLAGHNQVRDGFSYAHNDRLYTWWQTHPVFAITASGLLVAAIGSAITRKLR